MGKVFAIDGSYVTLCEFLSAGFLLGGSNRTQSHNHLVRKQTFNHYAELGFPICLQTNAEVKCCLNYYFYFSYLYCLPKLHGVVK